jgi:succinoglycan biosynthesis protein ExoH
VWIEFSQPVRRFVMRHISTVPPDHMSRTIDLSRIALIVGLVFLHYGMYPNFRESPFRGMSVDEYEVATFINSYLLFFFFSVVPLLSMVSGWLFFSFLKEPDGDAAASISKRIRRRCSSLYVPLIVWNSLYVAILIVLFVIVPEHPLFHALNVDFKTAGFWEFFNAIFAFDHHPLAFQFWFVRDLFLTVLLSPVIWLVLRRAPYAGALALFTAWFSNYNVEIFFRPDVPFFFYIGGLIRSKRFDLGISARATLGLITAYVVVVALRTMAPYVVDEATPGLGALTRLMRLIGVLACWGVFLRVARTALGARLAKWGSLAFFLHVTHFPLIAEIKLLLWNLLPQVNDFWMVTHYLVSVVVTITIGLGIGVVLSKYHPQLFAVLNGGRDFGSDREVTTPNGKTTKERPRSRIEPSAAPNGSSF